MLLQRSTTQRATGKPMKGDERLIRLTDRAGEKCQELCEAKEEGSFLRIAITGGGCNGLSYDLNFEKEPFTSDILVDTGGTKVLVDTKSALYLRGSTLDYSDELMSGGFKFSNPNSKSSCSCGESFSV